MLLDSWARGSGGVNVAVCIQIVYEIGVLVESRNEDTEQNEEGFKILMLKILKLKIKNLIWKFPGINIKMYKYK